MPRVGRVQVHRQIDKWKESSSEGGTIQVGKLFRSVVVQKKVKVVISLQDKPHKLRYDVSGMVGRWLSFFQTRKPHLQGVTKASEYHYPLTFEICPPQLPFGLRFDPKSGLIWGVPGSGAAGESIQPRSGSGGGLFGFGACICLHLDVHLFLLGRALVWIWT